MLDLAIDHGMKVLGHPYGKIEYRWGERDEDLIMDNPGVFALTYKDGMLEWTQELRVPSFSPFKDMLPPRVGDVYLTGADEQPS